MVKRWRTLATGSFNFESSDIFTLSMIKNNRNNWKKHILRFGLSKDKYYIIRRAEAKAGLFSIVNTTLGHIVYAVNKGYIPVVDMKNYPNPYIDKNELGFVNAWDRLFEQPCGKSLEQAYDGKFVIISDGAPILPRPDDGMMFFDNYNGELDYWREQAHKYIKIRKEIKEDIEKEYSELVRENDRVLGVLVRGTDYTDLKPYQHPVQPQPTNVIEKCYEMIKEYNCNKVFVATEDEEINKLFMDAFGTMYITNKRDFVCYKKGVMISDVKSKRENDSFLRGKEYLSTIAMLSKSNVIIGGRTSGTIGAMLLADGYEYSYIYNLGRYGTDENW